MTGKWTNSPDCFGCGPGNEAGLQLVFESAPDGTIQTEFTPRRIHTGWEGVCHGGILAALLDETMIAYLKARGESAATASLEVRFRRPAPIGEALRVEAREVSRRGRLVRMEAKALRGGQIVVEAVADCIRPAE
ncbi:MAG: PaaI family thioesterase [Gemmatimonadota bacterium]|nr:PaaI family thioesterase [Gemmatimonadota bacterium]MDP6529799.1 PaaI family thioesterase [Gemmatimonadota bacterium]MDP6802991.1 PaaI family thioesterase [Gemmatimonadota bacterium]MDP7032604.1 PaaI family thioesterase [Gemmatimonadota bacterium]